jgi:hypothetical protein
MSEIMEAIREAKAKYRAHVRECATERVEELLKEQNHDAANMCPRELEGLIKTHEHEVRHDHKNKTIGELGFLLGVNLF